MHKSRHLTISNIVSHNSKFYIKRLCTNVISDSMRLYKFQIEISNNDSTWVVCYADARVIIPPFVEVADCNQPMNARHVRLYRDQVQKGSDDDINNFGVVLNICEFQVFGLYTFL